MRSSGLHLLEILLYFLIISGLIYVAYPSLASFGSHSLRKEVGLVESYLRAELLLASQREHSFEIHIAANSLDSAGSGESYRLPEGYQLSSSRTQIHAYPRGVVSPTSLTISGGGASCTLRISLRGRIRNECP